MKSAFTEIRMLLKREKKSEILSEHSLIITYSCLDDCVVIKCCALDFAKALSDEHHVTQGCAQENILNTLTLLLHPFPARLLSPLCIIFFLVELKRMKINGSERRAWLLIVFGMGLSGFFFTITNAELTIGGIGSSQ